MEITDLTPAERRVWEAFPRGEGVDLREGTDDDPAAGASWGPERTIRAEVLRTLLIDGPAHDGEIAGLKLTGARITGQLHLKYGTVEHAVRLRSCHVEQAPDLYGAQIRALVLSDSVLPGLTAGTPHVDGVLRLSCCRITGPVRLQGARLSGAFFVNGDELGRAPDAPDAPDAPGTSVPVGGDSRWVSVRFTAGRLGASRLGICAPHGWASTRFRAGRPRASRRAASGREVPVPAV